MPISRKHHTHAYSDIWVYDPRSKDANGDGYRDGVYLFASLKDKPAEGSGIYFGKDPHTLYVNVQHSGTGNDKTMATPPCTPEPLPSGGGRSAIRVPGRREVLPPRKASPTCRQIGGGPRLPVPRGTGRSV